MKELLNELEVHHTGYVVEDLDGFLTHMQEEYGLKADQPYSFKPDRCFVCGEETEEYELKIAMIRTGDHSVIEVIEPVKGNGVHKQFLDAGKKGIQHICFTVDNYDYWRNYFGSRKSDIVFEAEVEDDIFGYRRCFYAEDKNTGMLIEIKEEPYFR